MELENGVLLLCGVTSPGTVLQDKGHVRPRDTRVLDLLRAHLIWVLGSLLLCRWWNSCAAVSLLGRSFGTKDMFVLGMLGFSTFLVHRIGRCFLEVHC